MLSWNDIFIEIVNVAVKAVTMIVLPYLAYKFSEKIKNDHAVRLIKKGEEFVVKSVDMVQQTFVDSLKKEGKFNPDAQREAFKLCYENWMQMANDEIKLAISEEVGNLDTWLNTMIEARIAENKIA